MLGKVACTVSLVCLALLTLAAACGGSADQDEARMMRLAEAVCRSPSAEASVWKAPPLGFDREAMVAQHVGAPREWSELNDDGYGLLASIGPQSLIGSESCEGVRILGRWSPYSEDPSYVLVSTPQPRLMRGWVELSCASAVYTRVYDDRDSCRRDTAALPLAKHKSVSAGPPDLRFGVFRDVPAEGDPCNLAGQEAAISTFVELTNVGRGPTPKIIEVKYSHGRRSKLFRLVMTRGLEPGESVDLPEIWEANTELLDFSPGLPGTTVLADPRRRVAEANEANNMRRQPEPEKPGLVCVDPDAPPGAPGSPEDP